jgi:TrmH family RNA methyltransferase
MISKEKLKQISKLLLKKNRIAEGKFIAEGKRLIIEALDSEYKCENVCVTNHFLNTEKEIIDSLHNNSIPTHVLNSKDFQKISSTKNSQGIVGVFRIPKAINKNINDSIIIGLENISDPGNLGTILRSCEWFGINTVLLSKDCAEIYNPKVVRSSMGAIFKLRLFDNLELPYKIEELKQMEYEAYYADMQGIDYRELNYNKKAVIIFCSEAFGPSNELKSICNSPITIPAKGNIDSLNVAAAAAVILSRIS